MDKNRIFSETETRCGKVRELMGKEGFDAVLVSSNANIFYLAGRVFSGFVYIPAEGRTLFFVRRPVGMEGDNVAYIKKPEQILAELKDRGYPFRNVWRSKRIGLRIRT